MDTKEKYTISEATAMLGFKSRSTLNKRTKSSGSESISYERDENGTKVIPLVELQRVFPERMKAALKKQPDTKGTFTPHSAKAPVNTGKSTLQVTLLEQKLDLLQQQLEQEQSERQRERQESQSRERKTEEREQHLREQISELTKTISQQTRLLEHHQSAKEEVAIEKEKVERPFSQVLSDEMVKAFKTVAFLLATVIVLLFVFSFFFQ